jgi:Histidine kinase-like ATPase domain
VELDEPGIAQKQNYRLPLPPHPIASRQAHKVLEWALLNWCVRGTPADDAHIVLGELVTNALMHSMDVFTLTLDLHGDRILIEVWDCTDATPEITMPDDLAVSGRGMFLVDALTKEWGVRPEEQGGKTVWATIPR